MRAGEGEMMRWCVASLLSACLLVGCADRNAGRMTKEELEAATRPWLNCVAGKLRDRYDGSASSTVIASSIQSECHRYWVGSPGLELPLLIDTVEEARILWRREAGATQGAAGGAAPQRSTAASFTPMKKSAGTYVVPVTINNAITLDFTVDSGASDVTIPADVVLTLIRAGTIRSADFTGEKTYVLADGTRVKSRTFRIRSLKVGDRVLQDVVGSVAPSSGTLLLGQSFLSRFKSWSIDNSRHALVLE